jgi:hypothetical protein
MSSWLQRFVSTGREIIARVDATNCTEAAELRQNGVGVTVSADFCSDQQATRIAQGAVPSEFTEFDGDAMLVDVALRCGMPLPTSVSAVSQQHCAVVRVLLQWLKSLQSGVSVLYRYSDDELRAIDQMRALKRTRASLRRMGPRERHLLCHVGDVTAQFRHALVHVDYFDLAVPGAADSELARRSARTVAAFDRRVVPQAATFVERYVRSLFIKRIDLSGEPQLDHLAPLSHAARATIVFAPHRQLAPGQAAMLVHDQALLPSELFDIPLPFVEDLLLPTDCVDCASCCGGADNVQRYVRERTRVVLLAGLAELMDTNTATQDVVDWCNRLGCTGPLAEARQSAIVLLQQNRAAVDAGQSCDISDVALAAMDAVGLERRVHLFRPQYCADLQPRTVTVFFGGTCSSASDCVHSSAYPAGELVSSLAALHPGTNGDGDYIYVDGIAGAGVGFDHGWRYAPHGQAAHAVATGSGIVGAALHALCWLKGFSFYDTHTAALGAAYGSRAPIARINVVGWSRGGVTAIVLSHLIAADDWLGQCEVNVLAIDPVPGGHSTDRRFVTLPARLRQFVGIYALSDRSDMFAPTVPAVAHGSGTLYELDGIVGAHATLVGAQHANLSRPTGPIACAVAERVVEFLCANGAGAVARRVQRPTRVQLACLYAWLRDEHGAALDAELARQAIIPPNFTGIGGTLEAREWLTFANESTVVHRGGLTEHVLAGVDRARFVNRHHQSL